MEYPLCPHIPHYTSNGATIDIPMSITNRARALARWLWANRPSLQKIRTIISVLLDLSKLIDRGAAYGAAA